VKPFSCHPVRFVWCITHDTCRGAHRWLNTKRRPWLGKYYLSAGYSQVPPVKRLWEKNNEGKQSKLEYVEAEGWWLTKDQSMGGACTKTAGIYNTKS
jgi:hypothetical protein